MELKETKTYDIYIKRCLTPNLIRIMANNQPVFDNGTCTIGLDPHVNKSHPPCGHVFHFHCLSTWFQIRLECPVCKEKFPIFMHTLSKWRHLNNLSTQSKTAYFAIYCMIKMDLLQKRYTFITQHRNLFHFS